MESEGVPEVEVEAEEDLLQEITALQGLGEDSPGYRWEVPLLFRLVEDQAGSGVSAMVVVEVPEAAGDQLPSALLYELPPAVMGEAEVIRELTAPVPMGTREQVSLLLPLP